MLTALLIAVRAAASASDTCIEPPLQILLDRSNSVAFLHDRQLRLYLIDQAHCWISKAAWKKPRAPAKDFTYTSVALEAAKPISSMPTLPSSWREVTVLSTTESERWLRTVANHLVPLEPGRGILCHYAFGEAILFREPTGQLQLRSGADPPPEVRIVRRYNRHELATATAAALEVDLHVAYPNQTAFLLCLGSGSRFRLAFVDLLERTVVVLFVPGKTDDPRPAFRFGSRLSNLASFILVDHAWTFVNNPASASIRTLNQWVQWPLTLLAPPLPVARDVPIAPRKILLAPSQIGCDAPIPPLLPIPPLATNSPAMDLPAWEQWLDHHLHPPRERGSVRLLVDGDQFFPLLQRRVAEARTNVSIHICIFDRDDVAIEFADLLKQHSTNIDVKVVFDRLMSRAAASSPPATPMRAGFIPPASIAGYLRRDSKVAVRPQTNPGFAIDHSKFLLVDGQYAFLGGMNLGREYRYEWHDLMAELQGPVVAALQQQFDKNWTRLGPAGDFALAAQSLRGKKQRQSFPLSPSEEERGPAQPTIDDTIELRRLYTKPFARQIRRAELAGINRASHQIFAENPYFFSNEFLIALSKARRRGVDVRVILPSENDLAIGHRSNLVIANYLFSQGVRVFFYPGMTHVKALLVDGWACFGSANFDPMSLRINGEANLATSDPAFVRQFKQQVFETDFARSHELHEALAVNWTDYLADTLLTAF